MSKPKNQCSKGHGTPKAKERDQKVCIRFKCSVMNTLTDVLRHRPGWVEVKDEGEWDFYWCDVSWLRENFDHTYMDEHVRISHFRNHYELTRKNYMVKNLKRFRKQLEREVGKLEAAKCDFFPKTFELPSDYHLFVEEFRKTPGITWIMKPVARSQGKGIFLFRKLKDIMDWRKLGLCVCQDVGRPDDQKDDIAVENYVAQRYIENPYLIGGRKFDLRVYVLVMSYIPLRAWLYRDGFVRFSNTRFTLSSIDDHYVHLTNVAVQKTSPDYDPEKGCKWMIQRFRQYLTSKHGPEAVETLFQDMDNIFIKSLQSVQKVIISDKHCFELYGYDILIDQDLKPWLLEVNASPSLAASSQEDYQLKTCLLEDTLHIVDMEARLTGKEKRVGGFDLMWNDGPVSREEEGIDTSGTGNFVANTHLGCNNDRKKQLRQLFRSLHSQKKVTS
ncbi:probable tubulin polyglutamylase TTLL9 isoform X1 [Dromiciops gliroides]|uniref:probable tubulin polyglutamylase TTLL9 isoform X1 n=1 Tax=Dromiciops gliroides TaxID=33562 RepID=UPI001CC5331B|nr:probable tubulin polyglutamylase TTLL9 isoform X1 [Dromiciops gliroides]